MNKNEELELQLVEADPPKTDTQKLEELLHRMNVVLGKLKTRKAKK